MDIYQGMAKAYAKSNNFDSAFKYQSLFSDINDTLYNIETGKKLGVLQFDFDLQKKQTEINLLTKDKALTDLQLKRQKLEKQKREKKEEKTKTKQKRERDTPSCSRLLPCV